MAESRATVLQGTLDLLILKALSAGELHGLGVSRRIEQITRGTFSVQPGSLFPALHRLEEAGALSSAWQPSENNRRAKFYALTKAGRRRLGDETAQWNRVAIAIGHALETAESLPDRAAGRMISMSRLSPPRSVMCTIVASGIRRDNRSDHSTATTPVAARS